MPSSQTSRSLDPVLVTSYGYHGAEVITDAAEQSYRAIYSTPGSYVGQSFVDLAERLYNQYADRDSRDPLTADMLAELILDELGYCFTRVGSKLIVEN